MSGVFLYLCHQGGSSAKQSFKIELAVYFFTWPYANDGRSVPGEQNTIAIKDKQTISGVAAHTYRVTYSQYSFYKFSCNVIRMISFVLLEIFSMND
jgi:hypothetical protein